MNPLPLLHGYPPELQRQAASLLRMIVVHELAHVKHQEHDAAFYKLCCHMEPEYHQLELDLRLWLSAIDATNAPSNSIQ